MHPIPEAVTVQTICAVRKGEELCFSYAERKNQHWLIHFGFVPASNPQEELLLQLPSSPLPCRRLLTMLDLPVGMHATIRLSDDIAQSTLSTSLKAWLVVVTEGELWEYWLAQSRESVRKDVLSTAMSERGFQLVVEACNQWLTCHSEVEDVDPSTPQAIVKIAKQYAHEQRSLVVMAKASFQHAARQALIR